MIREDGQCLGHLPGQQCPGDVGIDVEVIGGCLCAKGQRDGKFPNGVHGGPINSTRGDSRWQEVVWVFVELL